jgi:hypothetical protein
MHQMHETAEVQSTKVIRPNRLRYLNKLSDPNKIHPIAPRSHIPAKPNQLQSSQLQSTLTAVELYLP